MLIANLSGNDEVSIIFKDLPWPDATRVEVRMVNGQHAFDSVVDQTLTGAELAPKVPAPAVALVTLRPQRTP